MKNLDIEASRTNAESSIRKYSRYIFYEIGKFRHFGYGLRRDDLLQDIYMKIWMYYKNNDKDIPISGPYIDRIINSVLINSIKKSKNEIKVLNQLKSNIQDCFIQGDDSQLDILKEVIRDALNKIKAPSRIAISLYLTGLTLTEIAKLNGWSRSKTNNLYYRGIDALKKKLREEGIYYED